MAEGQGQKLVDEGGSKILKGYFGAVAKPTSYTLRLFSDNATLNDADIVSSRTAVTGGGYADITLYPEGGAAPAGVVADIGGINQISWPQQTFNFTGAIGGTGKLYGYMIFDDTNVLHVEELFAVVDQLIPSNGASCKVTPIIKIGNGTPA